MLTGSGSIGNQVAGLTCVTRQFPADPDVAFASLQTVDGADIVQAAAGHVVARGGVCTCHHPGGAQGNGVDLGQKVDTRDQHLKMEFDPTIT